jgi:asparagine synthase (glutamine-hydrolysing)
MCGIAGVVGTPVDPGILRRMAATLVRRGPDDEGIYCEAQAGLAFRRLAIVDLAGGRQPMINEDGRLHLVFNGEIYDHEELRRQLVARGHRFVTDHSDTEVLVHGWEEWGHDLFPRLNGMFAIAVWDQVEQTLTLARDRYGIKPLYYAPLPSGACVFGSEIKAIFASGLVPQRPNPEGVMEYFAFQNLIGRQTTFAGVYQLEPGVAMTWKNGRLSERVYWDISFPRSRRAPLQELAEEHRSILSKAIRRQMMADVPVQTYLSGGIDSTAITVIARYHRPDITAYSCIFQLDGVGDDRTVDEREFSRLVAREADLERIELELDPTSLQDCLEDYLRVMEDPRMGPGYVVYRIAQRVARDAKVVLSGTGGDEFHAGYVGRYQALGLKNLTLWQRCKRHLRCWVRGTPAPSGPAEIYRGILNCFFRSQDWDNVFTPEFLRQTRQLNVSEIINNFVRRCPSSDWRDRVLYVDAKTYLHGLLVFEDKVSMAHSLETRVPLLDNELVDFLLDVPFETLWQGNVGKILFRESVRPMVPPAIYQKPKMGFGPPDASWYRGKLRPWLEELLRPLFTDGRGVFQPGYVRTMLSEHLEGRRNHYHLVWSLLNFEMWCRVHGFFGASASQKIAA